MRRPATGKKRFNIASELLDENAALRGKKIAIFSGKERVTYRLVLENVNRFANVLKTLGVKPMERVMVALSDSPMFVYAFLGSIRHGAWPVPVNNMLEESDYAYLLENSEARVLVTEKASKAARTRSTGFCYKLFADDGLGLLMYDAAAHGETYPSRESDIAFWLYSTGCTGKPKGVPHRHIDMIHSADNYAKKVLRIGESDILFSASKLHFAYGLGNGLYFPFRCGASTVLDPSAPSPGNMLRTVSACKPTVFFGVPAHYNSILKSDNVKSAFKSVRACISAGEALPPGIFYRWKEATGLEIVDGIGSTEALHIFISNMPGNVKPGTSGRVVPGYEAKVVDDPGRELPPGKTGHLVVRGESVTKGYWNKPEESKEQVLPGGWFKTGDMYTQEDGYFTCRGRGDDMLMVGNAWVSPMEIENVLLEHEAVHEAAVVGCFVDGLSEPFGYVSLNEDYRDRQDEDLSRELLQFVSKRLPESKWLRGVRFMDELPKTPTGKIQRFKLKDEQRKEVTLCR